MELTIAFWMAMLFSVMTRLADKAAESVAWWALSIVIVVLQVIAK